MTITNQQFETIAHLAYLDFLDVTPQLDRCRAVIQDIEKLQAVDTSLVTPMHHPSSVTQYLRPDNHVISPNINDLAQSTTTFVDNFYTVPLILKGS